MASPLKSLINFFYPEDDDEFESTEPQAPATSADPQPKRAQRSPLQLRGTPLGEGGMEIRHPRNLDERMVVGMDLKHRRMVTLDLTRLNDAEARCFLEFINGVVFALDATVEKINDGIFLLAPHGIAVRNDTDGDEPVAARQAARTASAPARDRQEELFWQGG